MKRNLVGKILGKIKIFVQDFVPIRTALSVSLISSQPEKNYFPNKVKKLFSKQSGQSRWLWSAEQEIFSLMNEKRESGSAPPTGLLVVPLSVYVFSSHLFWTSGLCWTYQPGSHRISHLRSFCGACLNFSRERIQPFLSLVNREVEFFILTI